MQPDIPCIVRSTTVTNLTWAYDHSIISGVFFSTQQRNECVKQYKLEINCKKTN